MVLEFLEGEASSPRCYLDKVCQGIDWAAKPPGENIRTCVYPDNVESVTCGDVTSSARFPDQRVPDPPGLADAGRRFPWPRMVQRHCEIPLGTLGFQMAAEWVRYCGLYMPCMLYRFGFPITVI